MSDEQNKTCNSATTMMNSVTPTFVFNINANQRG